MGVQAEREAVQRGEAAAEKDARAKLTIAKVETETARRELEQELAEMSAEERIERERAQDEGQARVAHAEEVREAARMEREAGRAERIADSVDPEAEERR